MITLSNFEESMIAINNPNDRIVQLTCLIGELEMVPCSKSSHKALLRKAKKELRSLGVKIDREF